VESIVITWRELLIVVVLVLAIYVAEMLLLMRTGGSLLKKPRWLSLIQEKKVETMLRQEIEHIQLQVNAQSKKIAELESLLTSMQDNTPSIIEETSPYQRAIAMAQQGRDAEVITASCDISRSEAELIISLHGVKA
jgi:hypothetical protein